VIKILLAIKPEFALKIFNGTKKYEFRRSIFKNGDVKIVVVYASYPYQRVIGEFEIDEVIKNEPDSLWNMTKDHSGITKEHFDAYFHDRKNAFAIKIKKTIKYPEPKCLKKDFNIKYPPQSFVYLRDSEGELTEAFN